MIIEANVIYVLNTKSQGSTGKTSPQFPDGQNGATTSLNLLYSTLTYPWRPQGLQGSAFWM